MTPAAPTQPSLPTTAEGWAAWSRQAVQTMFERDQAWRARYGIAEGTPCRLDLGRAMLIFDAPVPIIASICLVGTTSTTGGTFLWSWANSALPPEHGQALQTVRAFGQQHQLGLLTTPEIAGSRPEALECLCIAAHLQHAIGTFTDQAGDVGLYFSILHLQAQNADSNGAQSLH